MISPSIKPFNKVKYMILMDGLECSEILFSKLREDNEKYRLDSEFFQKKYLSAYNLIKTVSHSTIKQEYSCLTDFHANGSYKIISQNYKLLDHKDYAYMVRTTDLETNSFSENVKYISEKTYNFLSKSKVFGGEVLINKIGSPGRTFLMPNLKIPVSLGMNLFLIKLKTNGKIDEPTLWLFLNTKLGKSIIERKINGTVPLTIDKAAIKSLYIPYFSKKFRARLSEIIDIAYKHEDCAQKQYTQAKCLLSAQICMDHFNDISNPISIKYLSESFLSSGRLDAEYYQPKYDMLFNILKKFNTQKLGGDNGIVDIKKSIEPGSNMYCENGIPFVRASDITKYGISSPRIKLPNNIVADVQSLYPNKDTILFSKDGSVGIAYKIEKDVEIITSGALLHLIVKNKNEILPDYLTLLLNSPIVQLQAERDSSGAIIQHWKPSEIENVIIPILKMNVQKEIAYKVQQSFRLRHQSENLIECAKQAVEMAIEQGEKAAIEYINTNVNLNNNTTQ